MSSVRAARLAAAVVCAVLVLGAAACDDSPTGPSGGASLNLTDLRVGTGAEAVSGSVVSVHYSGWFYNPDAANERGAQFDTSAERGPFTFTLGIGQVIAGWDQGVAGMRVGGLRRLIVPPSLAYGSARNSIIPPHATLVFEIELLEVE